MSAKSATLAKSLHTVSVLVSVARLLMSRDAYAENISLAVSDAMAVLGYEGATDPHGLAAKVVDVLRKEAAKRDGRPTVARDYSERQRDNRQHV